MLESAVSIWASMNSWLTPAVLFLLLNLMIGTIAVTSAFSSHHHQHHHQQQPPQIQTHLTRSPSVLQRLKSLDFYAYIHHPSNLQPPPPSTTPEAQTPVPETETHLSPPPEENYEGPTLDEVYSLIVLKGRQKSHTKPSGCEIPLPLSRNFNKSSTDNANPEPPSVAAVRGGGGGGDVGVDAKADDFINRFRKQLHLQRL